MKIELNVLNTRLNFNSIWMRSLTQDFAYGSVSSKKYGLIQTFSSPSYTILTDTENCDTLCTLSQQNDTLIIILFSPPMYSGMKGLTD